jgi:octaprenyl-diphosphate synthase
MPNEIEITNSRDGYSTYLDDARRVIDQEISNLIPEIVDLKLCDKIVYVLRTQGKRLRPILVMLSAQSVGGRIEPVKKLALSLELLHTATLIHDDILDYDLFRRSTLSAHAKWGVRNAILIGDVLASLSLNLVANYGQDVVKEISRTCMLLSDGEYMDIENSYRKSRKSDYMETIKRKSASLFRMAARSGAMAAKASCLEVDALSSFGEDFGLAYQILDDLSDVTALKNAVPRNINEFRTTLPIIHLCECFEPSAREAFFEQIVSFKTRSTAEKASLLNTLYGNLENSGALRYCADRANQCIDDAIAGLRFLRKSVYKDYLVQMADLLRIKQR